MSIPLNEPQIYEALTAFAVSFVIGLALMRIRWFAKFLLFVTALAFFALFLLFGFKDLSIIVNHIVAKILNGSILSVIGSLSGGLLAALYSSLRRRGGGEE